jgi:putative endonuclease
MYYTYIIFSPTFNLFYKGFTTDPEQRLWEHNNGMSSYTAGKGPWMIVYLKAFETKREALIDEKRLKKLNHRSIGIITREFLSKNKNLYD